MHGELVICIVMVIGVHAAEFARTVFHGVVVCAVARVWLMWTGVLRLNSQQRAGGSHAHGTTAIHSSCLLQVVVVCYDVLYRYSIW